MTFTDKLQYGQAAESLIAKWFMRRGHCVLPVYEKIIDEGKGPQLFSLGASLIAPDLLVINSGKVLWIEAKHKTAFTWYRIGQCFETGIDLRHYNDYLKVSDSTTFPVWLLFLHDGGTAKDSPDSPSGLFGNDLSILSKNESHRSEKWGRSGMVYWKRESDGGALKYIASLNDIKGAH